MYNNHGDVSDLTDANGNVIRNYNFFGSDAFGDEKNPDSTDTNPFRYCGEYYDAETGYIYLRARYYDPSIGTFISEDNHWNTKNMIYGDDTNRNARGADISAILQSSNLYVYSINNPVKYSDFTGNRAKENNIWSMKSDDMGRIILQHYLYGGGKKLELSGDQVIGNNFALTVGEYMMNDKGDPQANVLPLGTQVKKILSPYASNVQQGQTISVDITTSITIENGEDMIGYQYLHGTNADVGGFQIKGEISNVNGDMVYDLTYTWNDIIDPNYQYVSDSKKAKLAEKIPGADPKDYVICISWSDRSIIRKKEGFFSKNQGWLSK